MSACKKDTDQPPTSPAPQANFAIDGQESASVTLKSTWDYYLENKSQNAESFTWTLGDGTTSTKKHEIFKFNKPGNYTISLAAKSSSGETSVAKKQVKIVATVLRNITIQNIDWRAGDGALPKSNNADVWVEITKREEGVNYPLTKMGAYDAPVVYRSPVYYNATPDNVPITFKVSEKSYIDETAVAGSKYDVQIHAKDAQGTYLLLHKNLGSYSSVFNGKINKDTNGFLWNVGFSRYSVDLTGNYE
ncbi:hypothetical protein H7F33_11250 [Pedobacter sp. PAMC26386]|nr:hypothetical protein H7F33_11250 [Pedobacter sp. PAMC26386]